MPDLQTERLQLVTFRLEWLKALLQDKAELEKLLNARVPTDWPGPDYAEILPWLAEEYEKKPTLIEWTSLILHRPDRTVIGDIGSVGGPNEAGAVEIGYSIVPTYRGQGYATEAAHAIVEWILQQSGVKKVTAECLNDNFGSIRVLEKIGMTRLEPQENMLKWEKC